MSFAWTPHRFAGGALALDVANSVILRFDAGRSTDRFSDADQLEAFAEAATRFCAERALFGDLQPVRRDRQPAFLALREAIDAYFRKRIEGEDDDHRLANLLSIASVVLGAAASGRSLEAATARSAIRLLSEDTVDRLKICGQCGWLFIDRSRNRSRSWCDMAVCGNRVKASRHYHRKRKEPEP